MSSKRIRGSFAALSGLLAWGLAPAAVAGSPPVPRYYTYQPPADTGNSAGEPSMGFNLQSKRAMFIAGLRTLRVTFPDRPDNPALGGPASGDALWEDVSTLHTTLRTLDPVLHLNPPTGRTFVSQTTAGEGTAFLYAYTDDDGATWSNVSAGPPNGGVDHQTIGSGPYPDPLPPGINPTWPAAGAKQAVYYCSQDVLNAAPAWCTRSDDGGLTWSNGHPTSVNNCISSHGMVKVGHDGTVYLPAKACGTNQGMHASTDAGRTWSVRRLNGTTADTQTDPSLAIASDDTLYHCYVASNKRVRVAVSRNRGATWTDDQDIGASVGVVQAVFPEAIAGDPDRAACAFLGTNNGGDRTPGTFTGVWYPYIATTYDGGKTWVTVNVTPNDPVQGIGGLCTAGTTCSGTNRNLLDFNHLTIDDRGYAMFAYADGCTGACVKNPAFNGFTSKATITRQVGGWPLFAAFDPVEPRAPDAPFLAGLRTIERTSLNWRVPENGGSAISRYNVYRGTSAGNLQRISSVTGAAFEDITTDPAVERYVYRVTAVNAQGEGGYSNLIELPVVPKPPEESSCALPGVTVAVDPIADSANGGTNPPPSDFTRVSVAEPPGDPDKLVFTLKVESLLPTAPPDGYWFVLYQGNRYIAMQTAPPATPAGLQANAQPDALLPGPVWFRRGTYAAGTAGLLTLTDQGPLETTDKKSNYQTDGTIQLYAPRALFGAGNPPPGYVITPIDVRSRFGHTSVPSLDTAGPGDYTIRGLNVCLQQTPPVASLAADRQLGEPPFAVAFDASASYDLDTGAGTANDTIASYVFDFGDHSEERIQATPFASHTYTEPGDYAARLRVVDSRGQISSNTAQVVITAGAANLPPVAALDATPTCGAAPLDVTLDASATSDPDGDAIAGFVFDFGDGSAPVSQEGASVAHRYETAGSYQPSVVATDARGATGDPAGGAAVTALGGISGLGFIERTGVATSAFITSEATTLGGFPCVLPITVATGQYSVDGAAYTSAPGQIRAGQALRVRHVSATTADTATETPVDVGGFVTVFRSVTSSVDRTPDGFSFGTTTGVVGGSVVESDAVEITGFNTAIAIAPGPGIQYHLGDGNWSDASGTLPYTTPWTKVTVRHTATTQPLGYTKTYLKIGGVTGYFTTRTR